MNEKRVFIDSVSGIRLEALLAENSGENAVLIAHPHPLYGGDMHNNVVEAVTTAYKDMGYTTVRFNFRGVGRSGGSFNNGIGEREDVKAVFRYLLNMGKEKIAVAGYSFGAWVAASCVKDLAHVDHLIFISPPVAMVDFSFLEDEAKIMLIITGSHDYIAPSNMLEVMLSQWNVEAKLKVIKGADHFYWGKTDQIKDIIKEFLKGHHEI